MSTSKETNKNYLEAGIKQLPIYLPNPKMWSAISAELDKPYQELNQEDLKAAIIELPEFQAHPELWDNIDLELNKLDFNHEINRGQLEEAVQDLPHPNSRPDLWDSIGKELEEGHPEEGKANLYDAIADLPIPQPKDSLWVSIEKRAFDDLEAKETKLVPFHLKYRSALALAAILLLTFGLGIQQYNKSKVDKRSLISQLANDAIQESLSYSQEAVDEENSLATVSFDLRTETVIARDEVIIKEYCCNMPDACQNPHFSEVHAQWEEVQVECTKLKTLINNGNNNQQLIQYLVRLEKQQSDIKKELIQLIVS